jgi:hypothetical protein
MTRENGRMADSRADTPAETPEFWRALDQEDLRDAYALIQDRIRRYREAGRPVPETLHRRERDMMTEFMAQSQGR